MGPLLAFKKPREKYALTIDPGSNLGYSIWSMEGHVQEYGKIATDPQMHIMDRSIKLCGTVETLIKNLKPSHLSIENILPGAHHLPSKEAVFWLVTSYADALRAVRAMGMRDERIVSPVPSKLKKFLTGSGVAKKDKMIECVNAQLNLSLKPAQHNEADALALGLYLFHTLATEKAC